MDAPQVHPTETETNVASEESEAAALQAELDDVMSGNEFMRRQIDLFAAFIWRHEQKGNTVGTAEEKEEVVSAQSYDAAERALSVSVRLRLCAAEKQLIAGEVAALTVKSERDIDTLRAVLEECRLRMAETKKDAYDFRRDIVMASQQSSASAQKGAALKRFVADKLARKGGALAKFAAKNQALALALAKLSEQLKIAAAQSGDSFHVIDLEQLKIQNAQYSQVILERNRELLRLKLNTGKTVQQLNALKLALNAASKRTKQLQSALREREQTHAKLDGEIAATQSTLSKQTKLLTNNKHKIQNADIPHVIDYVAQKREQHQLAAQLDSYERKLEIAELRARRAAKVVQRYRTAQQ